MGIKDKHNNSSGQWSHNKLYNDSSSTKSFFKKKEKNDSKDFSSFNTSLDFFVRNDTNISGDSTINGYVKVPWDLDNTYNAKITTTQMKDTKYVKFNPRQNKNSIISELKKEVDYLLSRLIEDSVDPTDVRRCLEKVRKMDNVIGKIEDELKKDKNNNE